MQIKTFGKLTEIVNKDLNLSFPVSMVVFRQQLEKEFSDLQQTVFKIAVNGQIINEATFVIKENDSIALLPPFSGG